MDPIQPADLTLTELRSRRFIWSVRQLNERHLPGQHPQKSHGNTGKGKGTGIGWGGYKPGAWSKPESLSLGGVDVKEQQITLKAMELEAGLSPELQKLIIARDGPDGLRILAASMVSTDEYRNGRHTVTFNEDTGLSPEQQKQFLADVDYFATNYPLAENETMDIAVAPSTDFKQGVGGETLLGTGAIRINAHVFGTGPHAPLTPFGHWTGGMPAAANNSGPRYVLGHEWGHAVDVPPPVDEAMTARLQKDLSRYGHENQAEAYAEAFVEWSLTGGKTTNPGAQEHAAYYKWGERWPSS